MLVTVRCASADYSLEVSPDIELEKFKVLVQVKSGSMEMEDMVFFHNDKILINDEKSLTELGVSNNDVLLFGPSLQGSMQNASGPPILGQPVSREQNMEQTLSGTPIYKNMADDKTWIVPKSEFLQKKINLRIRYKEHAYYIDGFEYDSVRELVSPMLFKQTKKKKINFKMLVNGALINPGCFAKWFHSTKDDENEIRIALSQSENQIQDFYRTYDINDMSTNITFYIDPQFYAEKLVSATIFSHNNSKIRVNGVEGETIVDALKKDKRFLSNVIDKVTYNVLNDSIIFNGDKLLDHSIKDKVLFLPAKSMKNRKSVETPISSLRSLALSPTQPTQPSGQIVPQQVPSVSLFVSSSTQPRAENELAAVPNCSSSSNRSSPLISEGNEKMWVKFKEAANLYWENINGKRKTTKAKQISAYIQHFSCNFNQSMSVSNMGNILKWSNSVGIIYYPNNMASATIWVVGHGADNIWYLMTNRHVMVDIESAESELSQNTSEAKFAFNYLTGAAQKRFFEFPKEKRQVVSDSVELDYALYEYHAYGKDIDELKLLPDLGKHTKGYNASKSDTLRMIAHPGEKVKQIDICNIVKDSLFDNNIVLSLRNGRGANLHMAYDSENLFYHCNSFHGSSGSPCFTNSGNLVSMQRCGLYLEVEDANRKCPSYIESGVKLETIITHMKKLDRLDIQIIDKLFPHFQEKMEIN